MNNQEKLKKIEREKEEHVTKLFWFTLEIAVIFGVPVFFAVLISLKLGGGKIKWIALLISFVISWVLMILRYRDLAQKMKKYDQDIKRLKEKISQENK